MLEREVERWIGDWMRGGGFKAVSTPSRFYDLYSW